MRSSGNRTVKISVYTGGPCANLRAMPTKKTSFTYKLTPQQASTLKAILSEGNYKSVKVEHTTIAVEIPNCRINLYKSNKCLVQGKEAEDFVAFVLEPFVLEKASLGYEDVLNPEANAPHMGVDESGKGDFFGPMVIASAFIDQEIAEQFKEMDVKDSKSITSEKKLMGMARDIRKILRTRFAIVRIGPEAYNRLYVKFRNLNNMLAWAHARAIENLLDKVPDCPRAISDQFGKKEQVENALMKKGRAIKLEQMHRAESDIAVAAASILARDEFVRNLKKMQDEAKIKLPKGASSATKTAAIELVKEKGPEALLTHCKCHFKTTDDVLAQAGFSREDVGPDAMVTSQAKKYSFRKKS